MQIRRVLAVMAACLALLLGLGQPALMKAQDAGDQIVETDSTPTPDGDDAGDDPAQSQDEDGAESDADSGDDTDAAADDADSKTRPLPCSTSPRVTA